MLSIWCRGGRETGEALTGADGINGVLFTGGAKTGLAINKMFADRLDVILALELGGNNPLIWWDTDDVDAAAFAVVQSAFLTAGQRCTCARRLIIPEGAAGDKAIDALTKLTDRLIIGAPFDEPQPFLGPVIWPKVAESLERAFDQRVEMGGKAIRNLSVRDEGSAFVTPGIVDVTGASAIPDEEHFGPHAAGLARQGFWRCNRPRQCNEVWPFCRASFRRCIKVGKVFDAEQSGHRQLEPADHRRVRRCALWRCRFFR